MEPILSKEEIAELLAAVKAGKVSMDLVDQDPQQARRLVHATEIDLFQAHVRTEDPNEVRVPNLDIVLDNFARRFSTTLTNSLQRSFAMERGEMAVNTFRQSLLDLENQGAIGIYTLPPLKYSCLFHFDSLLAFTLLEIMLGSARSRESLSLNRNLTTIELAILKTCMVDIGQDLQAAIRPVIDLQPQLSKVENNFRLVSIVEPEVEVMVIHFQFYKAGEPCGRMRFIVPCLALESLRSQFKALVAVPQATTNSWTSTILEEVMHMETQMIAASGQLNLSIRAILNLRPGDILELPYNPDQPLTIMVEEKPLFLAISGERNGNKAFHITRRHTHKTGGVHGNA